MEILIMKAIIKQVKDCSFIGKADSNHWTTIDVPKETCGSDAATHPMEMVLLAIGGCAGSDIVSILDKKRIFLDGFDIKIDAERADSYPMVFTKIHIDYVFYGKKIKPNQVEQAINLSHDKYCSVMAMLKGSVTITSSYKIIDSSKKSS
jgi:putative redox protein